MTPPPETPSPELLHRYGMYPFASSRQDAIRQIQNFNLAKRITSIQWFITANQNMKNCLQSGILPGDPIGTAYFRGRAEAEKDDPVRQQALAAYDVTAEELSGLLGDHKRIQVLENLVKAGQTTFEMEYGFLKARVGLQIG